MNWFLLAFIAMLAKSGQNFADKFGQQKFGSWMTMFLIILISTIVIIPIVGFSDPWPKFSSAFYLGVLASTSLYLVAKPMRLFALGTGDISEIVPLISLKSIFSLLFGWILLNEVPSKWGFLGVVLISLGGFLINYEKRKTFFQGILFSFKKLYQKKSQLYLTISLFIASIITIFDKIAINGTYPKSPHHALLAENLILLPLLLLILLKKKANFSQLKEVKSWKIPLIIAFFYTISNLLGFSALSMAHAGYVVAIKQLSGLVAVFGGVVFLKETGAGKKITSAILMGAGALLIGWLG